MLYWNRWGERRKGSCQSLIQSKWCSSLRGVRQNHRTIAYNQQNTQICYSQANEAAKSVSMLCSNYLITQAIRLLQHSHEGRWTNSSQLCHKQCCLRLQAGLPRSSTGPEKRNISSFEPQTILTPSSFLEQDHSTGQSAVRTSEVRIHKHLTETFTPGHGCVTIKCGLKTILCTHTWIHWSLWHTTLTGRALLEESAQERKNMPQCRLFLAIFLLTITLLKVTDNLIVLWCFKL